MSAILCRVSRKPDGWLKERSTCVRKTRPRWQLSQWEWCFFILWRQILVLQECLYIPTVRRNLISISFLTYNRFLAIFNKIFVSIRCDADEICCGMLIDNLYILEPISHLQVNSHESNHKRKEPSSVNQAQLWHIRLGHINLYRIHRLVRVDTSVH